MDRKNKIFFIVFFALLAGVVAVTFIKYFIAKDYYIEAEADCDPMTEKCFIWECDPNAKDESEKCTGNPEDDISYYKIIRKKANLIPSCDPNDENCDAMFCSSEMDCKEKLCDESALEEGQRCNDPEKYAEENPIEEDEDVSEEAEECAPDDEECAGDEDSVDSEDSDGGDMKVEEEDDGAGDESKINVSNFVG